MTTAYVHDDKCVDKFGTWWVTEMVLPGFCSPDFLVTYVDRANKELVARGYSDTVIDCINGNGDELYWLFK